MKSVSGPGSGVLFARIAGLMRKVPASHSLQEEPGQLGFLNPLLIPEDRLALGCGFEMRLKVTLLCVGPSTIPSTQVIEHEGKDFIAKGRKSKRLRVRLAILCNAKIECNWSLLPRA
jgi:hypothetical protein